ncbi:hypothetical protein ACNJGI_20280, partial [Mycobacterium tuberculosis]
KIAFALRNSALSRRKRFSSADSSVVVPGRAPASTCAWRTHLRKTMCEGRGQANATIVELL